MKSNVIIIIFLTVLIVGFGMLCYLQNIELFSINIGWNGGTPIHNRTWCVYPNRKLSNISTRYGDLFMDFNKNSEIKIKCNPSTMDNCVEYIHSLYPQITTLKLIHYMKNDPTFIDSYKYYPKGATWRISYQKNKDGQDVATLHHNSTLNKRKCLSANETFDSVGTKITSNKNSFCN